MELNLGSIGIERVRIEWPENLARGSIYVYMHKTIGHIPKLMKVTYPAYAICISCSHI